MNKQFLRFTLYSVVVYLTLFTLNSAVVAHYLSVEDGTRSHEVTDWTSGQPDKQYLDQFPNRRYAQSFATNLNAGEPYTVRQIYFHPSDRPPSEEINATLDTLVKEVQQFYADEMERHGFGRKTFRLETDAFGKTVKHFVKGKFTSEHYDINLIDQAHEEIFEQIEWSNHLVYLIFINDDDSFSSGQVGGNSDGGHPFGGTANITLLDFDKAPDALYLRAFHTIAHELGHAFGLAHDFRDDRYILSYGSDEIIDRLSFCTAEWLNVHRYFNTSPNAFDQLPKIEMLEPSLVSPPNTIRFRFEITHSERLHQAKLLMNSFVFLNRPGVNPVVLDCKSLNANNHTVEFVTTELAHQTEDVVLHVIDVHGNFTRQVFPFDITPLLLDSKPVSIPDAILAAAIGKRLGLAPGSPITQLDMLGLKILYFSGDFPNRNPEKEITNLTGLEHATNLEYLELPFNQIGDITPLTGLKKLRSLILL